MMSMIKSKIERRSMMTLIALVACSVGVCICTVAVIGLFGRISDLISTVLSGIL